MFFPNNFSTILMSFLQIPQTVIENVDTILEIEKRREEATRSRKRRPVLGEFAEQPLL